MTPTARPKRIARPTSAVFMLQSSQLKVPRASDNYIIFLVREATQCGHSLPRRDARWRRIQIDPHCHRETPEAASPLAADPRVASVDQRHARDPDALFQVRQYASSSGQAARHPHRAPRAIRRRRSPESIGRQLAIEVFQLLALDASAAAGA